MKPERITLDERFVRGLLRLVLLVWMCALGPAPAAIAQMQCWVTYRCPNAACANVLGAWSVQKGPFNFASLSQCQTAARNAANGTIASCSCRSTQPPPPPVNTTVNSSNAADAEQLRRNAEEQKRKAEEEKHNEFLRDRDATVLRGDTSSGKPGGIRGLAGETGNSGSTGIRDVRGPDTSSTFGIRSNPSNPDIGPARTAPSGTVKSALDQASSISKDSRYAAQRSGEAAKGQAQCGFDNKPCAQPDVIHTPRPAQTPATAALLAHIPKAAWGDKEIQKRVAWYDKYERAAIEKQGRIAELQKQIDSGKGDQAVLAAEKGTFINQLNDLRKLQKIEEDGIKGQLVSDQLTWIEKPAQSESKTMGKP